MKLLGFTALAACAIALPAFAQGSLTDPQTYLRGGYVELEGGSPFQGATTEYNSVQGVGSNNGSGHFQAGYFGGAIFGHRLAPELSAELEGVYFKNRYDTATEFYQQTARPRLGEPEVLAALRLSCNPEIRARTLRRRGRWLWRDVVQDGL